MALVTQLEAIKAREILEQYESQQKIGNLLVEIEEPDFTRVKDLCEKYISEKLQIM